ncbi:MAG: hypothetical protein PHD45_00985 [Bacteroidales bacterium]|nr:hypothetical protein [Bacteroidales bacterium]
MNNQTDFNRYNSLILYPVSVGSNIQNWEYEYNAQGLMSKRKDNLLGQEERFVYDNLFRLVSIIKEHGRVDRYNTMTYDEKGNILSKSDVGHYSYDSDKPNAISGLNNEYNTGGFPTFAPPFFNTINTETLNTEYDVNNKIEKISQGNKELKFLYSSTGNRIKTEYKVNNTLQKTVYYIGNYECEVYPNGRIREINYINTSTGHTIVQLKDNKNNIPTDSLYYIFKDHLGSYDRITNQLGQIVETYSFDAWGNRRQASDWTIKDVSETRLFTRGFTGHEHLDAFETINMNGRLYDPTIARFLSPDPYVASNTFTQDFNRYSYCRNNPLLYTDPSGEFIWLPVIAGAIIGTYMGGVIANNDFNPINWNYNSGKTWGYMLGGAIVGGFSGWAGGAIAASGMPMANTAGIMSASFVNSLGTHIYTGGQTPVSISFGIGSYDITNDKWDGIWNWGENSTLENIGYTFGAMANLTDAVSLFSGGGQNVNVNSAQTDKNDWWGHSSITDADNKTLVSVGPPVGNGVQTTDPLTGNKLSLSQIYKNSIKPANLNWDNYATSSSTWQVPINNVSKSILTNYTTSTWDLLINSCVGHTSRALWRAGVPNIYLFHPHTLNFQLMIRQIGIYSSPYLYQIP